MAKALNYEASIADSVTNGAIRVTAAKNPPGDFRYKDFVPSTEVKRKAIDHERRKTFARAPVARYERDYISPEESVVRRKKEKRAIMELAKQLWAQDARKRQTFKEAQKLIDSATEEQHDNPSRELQRAFKIVERYQPLSKQDCLQKATEQFYGVSSRA